MSNSSIYLTGWEYNRLLVDDPTKGVQSGLPGAVLSQGGAQFWLFEKVYCTSESLETELMSVDALGWAQGQVFRDLKADGILQPYSWTEFKKDGGSRYAEFIRQAGLLRQTYSRDKLWQILQDGDAAQLEEIKLKIIRPLCEHLHCVADVTPDAIVHWKKKGGRLPIQTYVSAALESLAAPILNGTAEFDLGMTICQRPGRRASPDEIWAQDKVVQEVEVPRIPSLLMGEMKMEDYLKDLVPHKEVYRPISRHILEDWQRSRQQLSRLRELAAKHIWPNLHGEWLPRLQSDNKFHGEFRRLLRDALLRAKMGPFLDRSILMLAKGVSVGAGAGAGALVGLASGSVTAGVVTGGITKEAVQTALEKPLEARIKDTNDLTLFFQAVKREFR